MREQAAGTGSSESDMADLTAQVEPSEGEKKAVPKCYPKWKGQPVFDGNKEVIGWTLNSISMLVNYVGVGTFFATTILRVATRASICHANNAGNDVDLDELCGPAITFIKPSSLLTFYAMVISAIVSCTLPFIGAIVDHTRHRLMIGRIMAAILTALLFPLIFLSPRNYITMLIIHACSVFFSWFVTVLYYAYLPELTTDELKLADWSKCITQWSYGVMVIYLPVIVGGVFLVGKQGDDIFTSRFSMAVIFGINFIFLQVSWWFLFEKREPLHKMPENASLCTVGFKQIYDTGKNLFKNYKSLKWYYLHITLANSGWQSFGIVILSYLTNFMGFTPINVAIAFECSLIASVPGAFLGTILARKLDPLKSARINLILMIICVAAFPFAISKPSQKLESYFYMMFVGANGGWKSAMDKLIGASIIPDRQSTEMMGFFLFVDQWLLWLPLLVFTLINEAGITIQINIVILVVYLVVAFLFLMLTGSFASARGEVNRSSVFLEKGGLAKIDGVDDNVEENPNPPAEEADEVIVEA